MKYLVTCDYEWQDQNGVASLGEARAWAEEHQRTCPAHVSFRVWMNTKNIEFARKTVVKDVIS